MQTADESGQADLLIESFHRGREEALELLYVLRDAARALGWIAETRHLRQIIALLAGTGAAVEGRGRARAGDEGPDARR